MDDLDQEWRRQGATLSDKAARKEYGLSQDELLDAMGEGRLHYRSQSMHANPWFRLLRREVEDLVIARYGHQHLKDMQARAELARVNRELKRVRAQLSALNDQRAALMAQLGE